MAGPWVSYGWICFSEFFQVLSDIFYNVFPYCFCFFFALVSAGSAFQALGAAERVGTKRQSQHDGEKGREQWASLVSGFFGLGFLSLGVL